MFDKNNLFALVAASLFHALLAFIDDSELMPEYEKMLAGCLIFISCKIMLTVDDIARKP